MKRSAPFLVALAFAAAVGARTIDEPALGGGGGAFAPPASVTTCPAESPNC